ncbi:MAG: SRPBCC family protein [Verrucomicrobia bacterium]|nr:SRPBCC family protein [Verrucomicrobiota bacterium]
MADNNPKQDVAAREIVNTRVFAAPRERVFAAFSDPQQVALWWGPNGFTNTVDELDLRVGGRWRVTMHAPNGANYPNDSIITEVVVPERLVFQHLGPIHRFQMSHLYTVEGSGTRLTWRMLFESAEEVAKIRTFIAQANEQNFDRLAAHLARG